MSNVIESFHELSISPSLLQAIENFGFTKPTPIQAKAIPCALTNRDVLANAQTGTGKTAAFCIPMLAKLEKSQKPALILVPTREIAVQITDFLKKLTQNSPFIRLALLIGGTSMFHQTKSLKNNPNVIIATPGRLTDHLRRGSISLFKTGILILDEADRMLDMGFAAQLNEILRFLPTQRQTMMFSATYPRDIQTLASKYLKDPIQISVGPVSKPIEIIQQAMIETSHANKNSVLMKELTGRDGAILIFARTKYRTDNLAKHLTRGGHKVDRIHGGRNQNQRLSALAGFKNGKVRILVATDLAARGIDVPHIQHVINYDLPKCIEDYVHRIGRTARAGARGNALSLVVPEEKGQWKKISAKYSTRAG